MNILPLAFIEKFSILAVQWIPTSLQNIARKHFEAMKIVDHQLLKMAEVMVKVQIYGDLCPLY